MTTSPTSLLLPTLERLARRSAAAVVARTRAASPGFNATLLERLSAPAGSPGSLLADPVFETARSWLPADMTLDALAGGLLSPALVDALDRAGDHAMPRTRAPYAHQIEAWRASLTEKASCLVTAGTGAGKTECFLIPILDDLLRNPGRGVRAILLYPLNALIDSQRERLAAWAGKLGGKVRFALFNGETAELPRHAERPSTQFEATSRKEIRENPPDILVTNITMLEYLMLRSADSPILDISQGALRWIVLDEAHGYVGAQAAEMALLLRRVRAGFGVGAQDVRLVATSATIGDEIDAPAKLRSFLAALAGQPENGVRVIYGKPIEPVLPAPSADRPIVPATLYDQPPTALWQSLASHPRLQRLRREAEGRAVTLSQAAELLFDDAARRGDAGRVLDAAALANAGGGALLPWRAHLFHRPLGGVWACIDPTCTARCPHLSAPDSGWHFGAIHAGQRDRCTCGAPAFETLICVECGQAHLRAAMTQDAAPRLEPLTGGEGDDFALDGEPDDDAPAEVPAGKVWLEPGGADVRDSFVAAEGPAAVFDNAPPEGVRAVRLRVVDRPNARCCGAAREADLRYGPAFFMSNALPLVLDALAPPTGGSDRPARGRRALSFSDSRQGVARLAAKLQQDSERNLTRAFLYHAVQERPAAEPGKVLELENLIARLRNVGDFEDLIKDKEKELATLTAAVPRQVSWSELVRRFAGNSELARFAGEVWQGRRQGFGFAEDPAMLAEMFLFRELFRRPKVQNNPETMGLMRLAFPALEARALAAGPPRALAEGGIDAEGWRGLALAAIDVVFRDKLAVDLPDPRLISLISPRFGQLRAVAAPGSDPAEYVKFPGPQPGPRPSALLRAVYTMSGGHWDSAADQARVAEILEALWSLIAATAARDTGKGLWRIDFAKASAERLDQAFVCPLTRRPYGYSLALRSLAQLHPDLPLTETPAMERVALPRAPYANPGGLSESESATIQVWSESDEAVAALRLRGLWTDLHDRVAAFSPFLRAQEHSAQIERAVLKGYVQRFEEGWINLLNCSTTMEMGVDIAHVRLVVNANVPPAIANYRQRAGRAGRRGEPWAFTLTFARDLPLDRHAADDAARYLQQGVAAPRVWMESAPLIQRHVNAYLLGAFLRGRGGQPIKGSVGAFFGAGQSAEEPVLPDAPADTLIGALTGPQALDEAAKFDLQGIVRGTVLADREPAALAAAAVQAFEALLRRWRMEHRQLLERAAAIDDDDARIALSLRAQRMAGEFLISELARRGFTPSYGFPTDVVSFDFLSGRRGSYGANPASARSPVDKPSAVASRTLDVAIREYAPGAELVIDGLVYRSEGLRPAWDADADASKLEDLRDLWTCTQCGASGLARGDVNTCPHCEHATLTHLPTIAPAGFVSRASAHTGYESLALAPFEMPRLSAADGAWCALPEAASGRFRCDAAGEIITLGSGGGGAGYAICLACGRAEPEAEQEAASVSPMPKAIRRHRPLLPGRKAAPASDGFCPGGHTQPHRVRRGVHLVHAARTDIFELQLPVGASAGAGLALAAGLREALSTRLGVEAREIGVAVGGSRGPALEARRSAYVFDRAAGGAGYAARLADFDLLHELMGEAEQRLNCADGCRGGCALCILRPDLNLRQIDLDRPGGLALAAKMALALALPMQLAVFGPETAAIGRPVADWLRLRLAQQRLTRVTAHLPTDPAGWELDVWPLTPVLRMLAAAGVETTLALPTALIKAPGFSLAERLALASAAQGARLARSPSAPNAGGWPVLIETETTGDGHIALACEPAEARPAAQWGAGATAPVVCGPAPKTQLEPLDAGELLGPVMGNAAVIWPGRRLDGSLAAFGERFWAMVAQEASAAWAAVTAAGLRSVVYSDRYLVSPLVLALLHRIMMAAPGGSAPTIDIALAPADRARTDPAAVHDSFADDQMRRAVLLALFPKATVSLKRNKGDLPHHRRLTLHLRHGRSIVLLLDQGMGGWRSEGYARHDFAASAAVQAQSIATIELRVRAETEAGPPIAVELL